MRLRESFFQRPYMQPRVKGFAVGFALAWRRDGVIAPYRCGHAGRVTLPNKLSDRWRARGAAPADVKEQSDFQPPSGVRTFRLTRRIIPNNPDAAQGGAGQISRLAAAPDPDRQGRFENSPLCWHSPRKSRA